MPVCHINTHHYILSLFPLNTYFLPIWFPFHHTEKRITWNYIKTTLAHILEKVSAPPDITPTLIHLLLYTISPLSQHILNPSHIRSKLPSSWIYHILSTPLTHTTSSNTHLTPLPPSSRLLNYPFSSLLSPLLLLPSLTNR